MLLTPAVTALAALALTVCAADESAVPSVMIAMLVRNKEPYLPYTLTRLSELDYPKEQMVLWLRSDHNEDNSLELLKKWLERYGYLYANVDAVLNSTSPELRADETSAVHMSDSRYEAVTGMKEEALKTARHLRVDFVWFLDADVVLHENTILRQLLAMEKPLVAPMLRSSDLFSNFWAGMNDDLYYERTELYVKIYNHEEEGCFAVPMIHSCVLLDLREKRSEVLTFVRAKLPSPVGPEHDDIISFALSARQAGMEMHVCNQKDFGQVPIPLQPSENISEEWKNIAYMKLEALVRWPKLTVAEVLRPFLPPLPEKLFLGFDRVYTIGLARRPNRWSRVLAAFDELGIDTDIINAVDGLTLNDAFLRKRNITMLPGYRDPVMNRPLKFGEVGCFLSHYAAWTDMLQKDYERVIVFENDVRARQDSERKLTKTMDELDRLHPDWDLFYLYYQIRKPEDSRWVEGSENLLRPGYAYSGLAYALSRRGVQKLVQERPLQKMVPVDEFLPIMYGQHPNEQWKKQFPGSGSLNAFAAHSFIVQPYKYSHDEGYITDTEDSALISETNYDEQSCAANVPQQDCV